MRSLNTLAHLNDEAARHAKARGQYPREINAATVQDGRVREALTRLPNIGTWRPQTYHIVDPLTLDYAGAWLAKDYLGAALTPEGFLRATLGTLAPAGAINFAELCHLAIANPGYSWAGVSNGEAPRGNVVLIGIFHHSPRRVGAAKG